MSRQEFDWDIPVEREFDPDVGRGRVRWGDCSGPTETVVARPQSPAYIVVGDVIMGQVLSIGAVH
jgi:hypothetical protein